MIRLRIDNAPLAGRGGVPVGILPCRLVRENYWLSDDEKILKIRLFVSTEFTNVIDRQTGTHTHRRTPHDDIGRACVASRGKTSCWTQWTDSMFSLVFSIHRALCPASLSCLLHWACGRLWHRFLLRDAMHSAAMPSQDVCPSVCPSITRRYCFFKRAEHILKHFSSSVSHMPHQSSFSTPNVTAIFRRRPPNVECKGVWKNRKFRPIYRSISEMILHRSTQRRI